ncbi:MAG TPA: hypothetical protein VJ890_24415 [Vineibacter sp.]|nr:hypothetical protein [Vineibacter sp.]
MRDGAGDIGRNRVWQGPRTDGPTRARPRQSHLELGKYAGYLHPPEASKTTFYKIASLFPILLADFVIPLFLPGPASALVYALCRPATGMIHFKLEWSDLLPMAVGLVGLIWLLASVLRPRISKVTWTPTFSTDNAVAWNPAASVDYALCSTHPSYMLVDLFATGVGYLIYWLRKTEWQERWIDGLISLALGLIGPVVRLVAWYMLGLRPTVKLDIVKAAPNTARAMQDRAIERPRRPAARLYGWFVLPIGVDLTVLRIIISRVWERERLVALDTGGGGFHRRRPLARARRVGRAARHHADPAAERAAGEYRCRRLHGRHERHRSLRQRRRPHG